MRPSATMQANHTSSRAMVIRSRLRSATDDPPSEDDTPPPNRSDRPPPLPLCRRTSRTSRMLEIPRMAASV
jgi:hypothetical protein